MKISRAFHKLVSQQLTVKLAVAGFITALVLSMLVTILQLILEVNHHKDTVAADLSRLIQSARLPARNAVFTYDYRLGDEIVESLLLNDFIQQVSLYDEYGNAIAQGESAVDGIYEIGYLNFLLGEPVRSRTVELQLNEQNQGLTGTLEIQYNYHQAFKSLMRATWQRLALNIFEVSLLTAILIYMFNYLITRPVIRLTQQLEGIDASNSRGERLKLIYYHREDELGVLIGTLNHQLQRLDVLIHEKQTALNEAEQSYHSLHALVENLPHLINVKTLRGQPLLANQAYLNAFNMTESEFLDPSQFEKVFDGLTKSTRQLMLDADEEASESQQPVLLPEVTWRVPNGRYLSLEIRKLSIQYKGQRAILSVGVDITERKEQQAHIQHLAYHDALTDLPNRQLFLDRLEQALLRSQRSQQYGALIFVDLDNFKLINDTRGHLVGDSVLVEVAARLRQSFREEDTVARLGGDEFVICMTDLGLSEANARTVEDECSSRLMEAMQLPFCVEGEEFSVSASLGLAYYHDHSLSASELLRQADMAMYQAKESGKNQIIMFQKEMAENTQRLFELKEDSKKALLLGQFFLVYQPQVNSCNRRIIGAEALLRWSHPTRGLVSPGEFIPLLEESDMMPEIGKQVLEMAARQLAEWSGAELIDDTFKMSINVSPQQFRQTDFTETVRSTIRKYNLPAHIIDLEITEGMIIDNIDHTVAAMNELRAMGIHFSIDDFGTGYSNLNYLKSLPLDVLKVDQSFIRDIENDSNDRAIVSTIIAMADQLNLNTIAEGVETEDQLKILQDMGCRNFQGYLYSPALKNVEFAALLTEQLSNQS